MFGSGVLDIIIGLVFVYLLLSIICTSANEMIAALFSLRARNLAKGISNLLADNRVKGLDELFYDHPLIKSLYRGKRKPSYIPNHTFSLAFLDGIAPFDIKGEGVISEIKAAVSGIEDDSDLKRLLSIFLQQAGEDFTKLQAAIETWFNDSMARVTGWYKRKSQIITIVFAVLLTGATNADTLLIVKRLYTDSALRAAIVTQAQEFARQQPRILVPPPANTSEAPSTPLAGEKAGSSDALTTTGNAKETLPLTLGTLQYTGLPLGWATMPKKEEWINKIIGLLLTALAISLGAPFWFDVLNRLSKFRSTGTTPKTSAQEDKKGDTA